MLIEPVELLLGQGWKGSFGWVVTFLDPVCMAFGTQFIALVCTRPNASESRFSLIVLHYYCTVGRSTQSAWANLNTARDRILLPRE